MVEEYLLENSGQRIYRRELSGILHVSSSHLARVFKATTGVSIHQRLTKIRIEKAKKLLLETTLLISQVSSEVGMVSFSQFSRTFKQHVGLAPGGYRRSKGIKIE